MELINKGRSAVVSGVLSVRRAFAQGEFDTPSGGDGVSIGNPLREDIDTISEVLGAVGNFLFMVSIPLVTIMILWGAFQLLTASGNEERIRQGKRTITWAIIGLVVVLIAGGIATLVGNILGGAPSPAEPSGGRRFPGGFFTE